MLMAMVSIVSGAGNYLGKGWGVFGLVVCALACLYCALLKRWHWLALVAALTVAVSGVCLGLRNRWIWAYEGAAIATAVVLVLVVHMVDTRDFAARRREGLAGAEADDGRGSELEVNLALVTGPSGPEDALGGPRAAELESVGRVVSRIHDFVHRTRIDFLETVAILAPDDATDGEIRVQMRSFLSQWVSALLAALAGTTRYTPDPIWVAVRALGRNAEGGSEYRTERREGPYEGWRDQAKSRPLAEDMGVAKHLKDLLVREDDDKGNGGTRPPGAIEFYCEDDKRNGRKGWDRSWQPHGDERQTVAAGVFVGYGQAHRGTDLNLALIVYINSRQPDALCAERHGQIARALSDVVSTYYNVIYDVLDRKAVPPLNSQDVAVGRKPPGGH